MCLLFLATTLKTLNNRQRSKIGFVTGVQQVHPWSVSICIWYFFFTLSPNHWFASPIPFHFSKLVSKIYLLLLLLLLMIFFFIHFTKINMELTAYQWMKKLILNVWYLVKQLFTGRLDRRQMWSRRPWKRKSSPWRHPPGTHLSFSFLFCFLPSVAHILGPIRLPHCATGNICPSVKCGRTGCMQRWREWWGNLMVWRKDCKKKKKKHLQWGRHSSLWNDTVCRRRLLMIDRSIKMRKECWRHMHCQDKQCPVHQICHVTEKHGLYLQISPRLDLHLSGQAKIKVEIGRLVFSFL